MMQISKSEYMLFLKHPAWLWIKKNDPSKIPPVDDNTQALFDAGHLFEPYAESLFPEGVSIGFSFDDSEDEPSVVEEGPYDGHEEAIRKDPKKDIEEYLNLHINKPIYFRYQSKRINSAKRWRELKLIDFDDNFIYTDDRNSERIVRYRRDGIVEYK